MELKGFFIGAVATLGCLLPWEYHLLSEVSTLQRNMTEQGRAFGTLWRSYDVFTRKTAQTLKSLAQTLLDQSREVREIGEVPTVLRRREVALQRRQLLFEKEMVHRLNTVMQSQSKVTESVQEMLKAEERASPAERPASLAKK